MECKLKLSKKISSWKLGKKFFFFAGMNLQFSFLENASHLIQKKFNIIGSEDIEEKTNTIVISSNVSFYFMVYVRLYFNFLKYSEHCMDRP
jgi:hypothetical protein